MTKVILGEISTIITGFPFKSSSFSKTGTRLLRGDNIAPGKLRWQGVVRWQEAAPAEYLLRAGDVVLAMDRPWIGGGLKVAAVHQQDLPALLVQRVAALRARSGTDQRFLEMCLKAPPFASFVQGIQTGTAVPHISSSQIASYQLNVPVESKQRAIAAVLGALDDKIAANTALAHTADELSRARFQAMIEGVTAPLSSLARFINGRAFTKGASGSGRVVARIAELNSGLGGSTVYNDIEVADDHLARPGDLLFAWSGSLTLHRWYRPEAIINQHIFKVVPGDDHPMWMVYQALLSLLDEFKSIAADKATTMGHIQRRHLDQFVAIPSVRTIAKETPLMDGLWKIALTAEVESLTLAELRDTLLPALMSGRLRVKDVERQVEDAV